MLILCIFLSDVFHGDDGREIRVRFSTWSDDYGLMHDEESIRVYTALQTLIARLLIDLSLCFTECVCSVLFLSLTSSYFQLNIHFWIQTSGEGEKQYSRHTLFTETVCVTGIHLSRLQKQKTFSDSNSLGL